MASNGKFQGREVVIVEAVRTPSAAVIGRRATTRTPIPRTFSPRPTPELIERSGIDPAEVEDVVAGCVQQFGEQAFNIGRNAWLEAGLPIETPATTIDRQCGSAQQAINFAAALVASGVHDVAIGGGVEHMGHISFADGLAGAAGARDGLHPGADGALQPGAPGNLGRDDRRPVGDSPLRARRDRRALPPARRPGDRGGPLRARDRSDPGQRRHLLTDQGIRPDTSLEKLSRAEDRVQGGRQDHRRQLLADLRRRRRGAGDDPREGRRARASPRGPGSSTRRRSASIR